MEKQILLIEDDRLVAKSLSDLLTFNGFKVWIALDGDLAIKLAESKTFDLIISDIRMPRMLGPQVVKKINENRTPQIPFIFITGFADEKYIRMAEEMGCNDFFFKPFDTSSLLRSLRRILQAPLEAGPEERPVIEGQEPPSRIKRFFYSALGSQWNPEKEVDWNQPLGIDESLRPAMAFILSPIIMGEYSAFNGIPQRILSFSNYEVKQYLASQLVDETRHAEAFDLYLARIKAQETYKKAWRNIHVVRYFNEMKKLTDDDKWLTGLLVTEITAHVLLDAYTRQTQCNLTQHLFKMILVDEARHISFVNYYLKEVLKDASEPDRQFLAKVTQRVLELTARMIEYYQAPLHAFQLDPEILFDQIRNEVEARVARNILGVVDEWPRIEIAPQQT